MDKVKQINPLAEVLFSSKPIPFGSELAFELLLVLFRGFPFYGTVVLRKLHDFGAVE